MEPAIFRLVAWGLNQLRYRLRPSCCSKGEVLFLCIIKKDAVN
jgi:hypothetical protein